MVDKKKSAWPHLTSMIFVSLLAIVLTGSLVIADSDFNPTGTWALSFYAGKYGGFASGASAYSSEASVPRGIVAGREFDPSHYIGQALGFYDPITLGNLTITYHPGTSSTTSSNSNSITLKGGSVTSERNLSLPMQVQPPVSTDFGPEIWSYTTEIVPGCSEHKGQKEAIKFIDNEHMSYTIIYYHQFENTDQTHACESYLGVTLATRIELGSADDFWKAMSDSGALGMKELKYLTKAVIAVTYEGSRVS